MHEHIVTCHTEECTNAGISTPLRVIEGDPDFPHPLTAGCGVCGQPIDDVTPPLDHGEG